MAERMTKSFPIFDCDAHVNDPLEIWSKYVPESQKELVHDAYWRDDTTAMTNGTQWSFGGGGGLFQGSYNPICIAGPQMNKKILRRIQGMTPLTEEQRVYLEHQGAYNAGRAHQRDGPHGDRPGAGDPHHDDHELPVRRERRRREGVLRGVQQLAHRLVRGSAGAPVRSGDAPAAEPDATPPPRSGASPTSVTPWV